jgi:hypothetical protein
VGIYGFFARIAQAAKNEAGQELSWWETGRACARRYRMGDQWYNFRPDALAEYQEGQQPLRFWLEWDCGTMNARDLAIKCTSYGHYLASREWAKQCSLIPELVCVAPDIAQERRIQHVAQARLAPLRGFELWTATEVLLDERGPLAPIWLQRIPQSSQVSQPEGSYRHCLFAALSSCTEHV